MKELDAEEIRLEKEIEARVSELVKTKLDVVKSTVEKSIVKLDEDKKDIEAKRLYIPLSAGPGWDFCPHACRFPKGRGIASPLSLSSAS